MTVQHPSSPGVSNVTTPIPECGSLPLPTQEDVRQDLGSRQFSSIAEAHSPRKSDARHVDLQQHYRRPFIYVNSNHPQRVVKMRCPRGRERLIGRLHSKPCSDSDHSLSLSSPTGLQRYPHFRNHGPNEATLVCAKLRSSGNVNKPIEISSDSDGESNFNSSDTGCSQDASSHCTVDSDREFMSSRSWVSSRILAKASRKDTTISGQLDGSRGSKISTPFQSGSSDDQNMSVTFEDPSVPKTALQCAPAITNEHDTSEDSDPPVRFSRKRRIALHPGGKDRDLKDPDVRCRVVSPIDSEGAENQSSDSDAPLVSTWQEIQHDSSKSSPAHASATTSSKSQIESESEQQSPSLPRKRVAQSSHARVVSSKNVARGDHVIKSPALEVREPIAASQITTPVLRQDVKDEGQDCMNFDIMDELEQPHPACQGAITTRTYRKSTFSIKDIVGKDEPPKGHVFSFDDVIPKKQPKPVKTSVCSENLAIFHTALRACFPSAIIGPDYIQNGPVKNKEFAFTDVIGTAKRNPLFSVEYAIERYNCERHRPEEAADLDGGSQRLESEEHELRDFGDDVMNYELLEDDGLATPSETSEGSVEVAPKCHRRIFVGDGDTLMIQEETGAE